MRVSLKRGRFQSHTNQSYRNRHTVYAFVLGIGLSVVLVGAHSPSSDPVFSTPITSDIGGADPTEVREILDLYCVRCHNERRLTAGLALDVLDIEDLSVEADKWEKVVRKLRTGTMPPGDVTRPCLLYTSPRPRD